jgi:hypothetical protein
VGRLAIALALGAALLLVGCGGTGGGGGGSDTVQKDTGDIESDVSDAINAPRYQDVVQGEVTIHCPDYTADRLFDKGQQVQCDFTEFDVKPAGKGKYKLHPSKIPVGLALGG